MVSKYRSELALTLALLMASAVSVGLFFVGAWRNHSLDYWYLNWNLFLAWLPLVFALLLVEWLRKHRWSGWVGILLSALWLSFLPNSFYMVTDYIHLQDSARIDILYDAIMFTSYIIVGMAVGFISLYLLHRQFTKRLPALNAARTVGVVLFLCSFAIYLGRDLRWNTWDLLTNPAGVLFDVSDRLLNPVAHPQMFVTTLSFFALLSSLYTVIWVAASSLRHTRR